MSLMLNTTCGDPAYSSQDWRIKIDRMTDLEKSCTNSTSITIITHLKTPAPPPWIALRELKYVIVLPHLSK